MHFPFKIQGSIADQNSVEKMLRALAIFGAICSCSGAFVGSPASTGLGRGPASRHAAAPSARVVGAPMGESMRGKSHRARPSLLQMMAAEETGSGVGVTEGMHTVDSFECRYQVATPSSIDPAAPPLVLVHGFGMSSEHFKRNMMPLAEATNAPVYAVDLLGFGKSDKPSNILYSEALWSWQVTELMDEVIKAPKVLLAGNSMGGYVCMNVAADRQEDIAGICLINPSGRYGFLYPIEVPVVSDIMRIGFIADIQSKALLERTKKPQEARAMLSELYVDQSMVTDELVKSVVGGTAGGNAAALYSAYLSSPRGKEWDELLLAAERGYQGPILGVWGESDPWVLPIFAEQLQEMRPDAELFMVKGGHYPHDERAGDVNARVAAWARKLAESPAKFETFQVLRQQKVPLTLGNLF